MQRVVSINLNGNAYQIEENGYNALFAYLDAADAALKDSPDRAQTLADLERVVAEKCQACIGPHKTVVTSAEIDRIILELAPAPAQPAASNTTSPNQASPNPTSPHSSPHRRLFQIRDGAMISGVCVGLSEFLHIDVTIIRILFVIFALVSGGWWMLAYGVLMFVVPRVDTRAEASGGTASGTRPYEWPWDKHGWPWDTHGWPWDQPGWDANAKRDWKEASRQFGEHWRDQGRGPHHVFGTITMIMFLMIGFFWLSFWTRGHFFFGWPFFWGFPHWVGIIFFFMMLRLIFMPFRMARWHAYGPYGPCAHPHYAWVSMWNGLMWFGVMIFLVWAAYHYVPEVHDFIRSFQTSWSDRTFHV
jgi:phage shock protein PspC (stress-responsive transcriptional regulator)